MVGELQAVYRSYGRPACDERALMLTAVNIPSELRHDGVEFLLCVSAADAPWALAHLRQYEQENRAAPRSIAMPRLYPYAWVGVLVYSLVLLGISAAVSSGWWPPEAFGNGALDAARVQGGQWWRAWTALTLHVDADHLVANLGGGLWFGYLAARQLGSGMAWLL
ncbi:MAG: rhomboid family intramembrane serine protease, partial [Proteobacteria bacterium]|nr:rhomboid family intramembrane serine protease [Pseudomonadota bacterium]